MKPRYLYLLALAVAFLDQASKCLIANSLEFGTSLPVIAGVLDFTLTQNPGGAFGLFQSSTGLLVVVTVIVIAAIIVLVRRKSALPALLGVSLALQLGGALGNLLDRVRFGYVVDFIDFRVWPIFNIADVAITVGIGVLAYYLLTCEDREADESKTTDPSEIVEG